jgi:hypothetical protein
MKKPQTVAIVGSAAPSGGAPDVTAPVFNT